MIEYATLLRAIAVILITNSHYTNVYPLSIIASGGLLGDVIFFALSGFVLGNIKEKFVSWYRKRIIRIYPTVWIITVVYLIMGFYSSKGESIFSYFIYPTHYHFIASIVVLYIPYYLIATKEVLRNNIPIIIGVIFMIQIIIYLLFYDKSYYHIDAVREPMIRFLFFQSMLLGLYFRINHKKYVNRNRLSNWIILLFTLAIYFITKMMLVSSVSLVKYQLINQVVLFIVLFYIFKTFSGIEDQIIRLPTTLKKIIGFLAKITLQIYVVQYIVISIFEHIFFPLNWIIITTVIIIAAFILHLISMKTSNIIEGHLSSMTLSLKKETE